MRPHEIEAWALRIIDVLRRGEIVEDSRVELKADWPDPKQAARRLAAHANAARGERILWLIGADEERGVVGARPEEFSRWYPQVEACFDALAPTVQDVNVPQKEGSITAMVFETDRAPFVVKNPVYGSPGGGSVELEVPWREARATRSARREDLVRLLTPVASLPELEVLQANLHVSERPLSDEHYPEPPTAGPRTAYLNVDLYFVPRSADTVVIPFHRCRASASLPNGQQIEFRKIRLVPPTVHSYRRGSFSSRPDSVTIDGTSSELIIGGPGGAEFRAEAEPEARPDDVQRPARVHIALAVAGAGSPLITDFEIPPSTRSGREIASWRYRGGLEPAV